MSCELISTQGAGKEGEVCDETEESSEKKDNNNLQVTHKSMTLMSLEKDEGMVPVRLFRDIFLGIVMGKLGHRNTSRE